MAMLRIPESHIHAPRAGELPLPGPRAVRLCAGFVVVLVGWTLLSVQPVYAYVAGAVGEVVHLLMG